MKGWKPDPESTGDEGFCVSGESNAWRGLISWTRGGGLGTFPVGAADAGRVMGGRALPDSLGNPEPDATLDPVFPDLAHRVWYGSSCFGFMGLFFTSRQRKPTISRKNLKILQRKYAMPLSSWLAWSDAFRHTSWPEWNMSLPRHGPQCFQLFCGTLNSALEKENVNVLKWEYLNCIFVFSWKWCQALLLSLHLVSLSAVMESLFFLW